MENDMVWKNPAPDASAPMVPSGKYGTFTIGARVTAIPNPIEKHITSIREEFGKIDQQHSLSQVTIDKLKRDIEILNARLVEYQARYMEAEAKLEKIKGHL